MTKEKGAVAETLLQPRRIYGINRETRQKREKNITQRQSGSPRDIFTEQRAG